VEGIEWEEVAAGTHNNRVCQPIIHCTDTQWESVAPGPTNNRECTNRGTCVVHAHDSPVFNPAHEATGNPATQPFNALTDAFENMKFTSETASPVQTVQCDGDWCMSNPAADSYRECINDDDFGWTFYRPVTRLAISTPSLPNFKSASVWIYDEDNMVLDRRTLGAMHTGNDYLSFNSTCGIAKVVIEIHDYVVGSQFCLKKIWYDGQREPQACSHTTCEQELHTCQHWRRDAIGIVQPHIGDQGHCNEVECTANGNCNGVTQHNSIRVRHHMHDGQLDPNGGWLLKGDDGILEENCREHHHCGMGVVTGDTTQCECKEL
jgi:hypothetical protein